jgi:hypothetical protein
MADEDVKEFFALLRSAPDGEVKALEAIQAITAAYAGSGAHRPDSIINLLTRLAELFQTGESHPPSKK